MLVLTKLRKYIIKNVLDERSASLVYINNCRAGYTIQRFKHDIYLYVGCKKYVMLYFRSFTLLEIFGQKWVLYNSYKKIDDQWVKV
jgi:hypothetical protein